MNEDLKTWYYGVVFFDNYEASVSAPFDSKEKCIEEMKKGIRKNPHRVVSTTYITRKSAKPMSLKKIFGSPKSRDLMLDKEFKKELTYGKTH